MRHAAPNQLALPGFEPVAEPSPDPPMGEPAPVLEIPAELRMVVKDWRLPAGWTLQKNESVEDALACWLSIERSRSHSK